MEKAQNYLEKAKKQNLNLARFEERLGNDDEELHKKTINGLKKIGDLGVKAFIQID